MRTFLKCLLLFASIFAAAYVARMFIVPDAAPIAEGKESNWQIQVAFFLMMVQNIGLFGMVLVALVALPSRAKNPVVR
ncbi:MAG: hypothetical protein E7813_22815 [Bradyrhizobium sp.]|uniref:hypothetical protein n=1 Tax=Bradyrhizobium sp. TaxID=376 RepID=UPI0011FC7CDA|nr:hypothetical protein [Bradyrhizobium sp.]THD60331.1 MAG: hypothetical protein E7813_22815 [Bradyrhizobium sp.]